MVRLNYDSCFVFCLFYELNGFCIGGCFLNEGVWKDVVRWVFYLLGLGVEVFRFVFWRDIFGWFGGWI